MMKVLNLGCGTKVSPRPGVVNIDWSIYLRIKRNPLFRVVVPVLFNGERRKRFDTLPDNILVHDLSKGLPYDADSVDVVYHSHMLEHLDRDVAKNLMNEARRVLRPGGVHRIVVPDLERTCQEYVSHLTLCEGDSAAIDGHDEYVAALLEQSVRKESFNTGRQRRIRKFVENAILGDARNRGETHQWMYDRFNLAALLRDAGYRNIVQQRHDRSAIPDWIDYGLDFDMNGQEYKPGSLYMEAEK